jgi:aryl-alcohol dehydrogenase-like predicted oxidoreductase/enamine deaminase RidA (YjgF/YER057c/UK114 family)
MPANKVQTYKLAKNLEISRAITGLWQIADMEKDGNTLDPVRTSQFMAPYAEAGLNTFDMADHYGSAEIIAGTFKKNRGEGTKTKLLTKWVPKPGPVSREQVREAVQARLDRLQTKRVDLLQYHAWKFSNPYWLDALIYLQELKEEGLIRAIGTTNFDTAHLRIAKASGVDLVSNQISYSLVDRRGGGQMADYCAANGIAILAYGTLCGGFISKKWLGKAEPTGDGLSNWSLMKYKRFIDSAGGWAKFQNVLEVLNKVSEETDRSISTIASKYQLSQKAVGAVIIGARLGENAHIADAASLFTFELSKEQRKRIKGALDLLDPIPGDCGDEYRKPPYLTASGDLSHHLEEFPPVYKSIKSGSKERIDSGTTWETLAGYSRAVRIGDRVLVSGTTATHGELAVGKNDPAAQAHFIIDKIEASLESLGAKLSDVVRTRVFVNNMSDWEAISRAHGERFADIRPANTMFIAKLIGDEYLAEIEAEAVIQSVAE